jgi:hypothetical protein
MLASLCVTQGRFLGVVDKEGGLETFRVSIKPLSWSSTRPGNSFDKETLAVDPSFLSHSQN